MKPIIAKDQVSLSLGRCLQLALSGMSYRMFRSSVTVAILALAVAFLAHMIAYGLMAHEAQRAAAQELQRSRLLGQQITRLTAPDTEAMIQRHLATGDRDRLAEFERWAGPKAAQVERAHRAASRLREVSRYMDRLPTAAHAVIVADFTAEELFDRLSEPSKLSAFEATLKQLALPPPLGDLVAFRALLVVERPIMSETIDAVAAGHARAIEEVRKAFPGKVASDLAAHPPDGFAEAMLKAGFSFDKENLPSLAAFARRAQDIKLINQLVLLSDTRAKIARETDIALGDVTFEEAMKYAGRGERRARWFAQILQIAKAPAHLDAARVAELSDSYLRERKLQRAVGEDAESGEGLLGMSSRNRWLIGLSFLVCVVGVANAMLMSVTERFTEIATMKCLGAMDRFVMLMFVIEAVVQGIIGGAIGLVLGVLLALLRGGVEFGGLIAGASGAAGEIGLGMLLALLVGMVLAAVAAVGPSWLAARLAPMEAMRVD